MGDVGRCPRHGKQLKISYAESERVYVEAAWVVALAGEIIGRLAM